ncbi:MAG: hypothetical protein K0R59_758 [Sphingobacterium sp.]|jgi:hypothetical protein|uniref:hypothetical protein n=1 Tax=Sphingobacterium sp. NGMCC 1.201703 TaxID=3388657 RepID=UPI002A5CF159|nr:hypothetical protein [Sphingobacterium sp.]
MVHFFNALIILLFFMVLTLFSNSEARKHDEVFADALQRSHTDSLSISDKEEPVASPHFIVHSSSCGLCTQH